MTGKGREKPDVGADFRVGYEHARQMAAAEAKAAAEGRERQVMAVAGYAKRHPIVRKALSRDDFTLSNAAQATWNENREQWEKRAEKGGFPTVKDLQPACEHLRKKHPEQDPFTYRA